MGKILKDVAWRINESGINVERRHGFGSHGSPAFTAAPVPVPGMTQTVQNGAFGALDRWDPPILVGIFGREMGPRRFQENPGRGEI